MLAHFLPALCASLFAAGGCQQDNPAGIRARPQTEVAPAQDTTLVPIADTYIRQGRPNQNQGAELILRLESLLKNRSLLRWDQQALAQAVAGGTLTAARLELTIADLRDNWSTAGRTIELHRMTQAWTELGATWNCAVDSVPGNLRADCGGPTAWDMDHSASYPWVPAPTATALLRNNQTGVVAFDVTTDVQAWLAGQQPNVGWILKKTVEGDPGKVDFGSRESGAGPRLVLRIETTSDTSRPLVPANMFPPDDSLHTASDPLNPDDIYYRTFAAVIFDDSVSGNGVRAFLRKYQAEVVGGLPSSRGYIIRFADPGVAWDSLGALLRRMGTEPGVFVVLREARSGRPPEPDGRYPADGLYLGRAAWFDASSAFAWAGLAVRAPLAWGCENGMYGSVGPRVGVVEMRAGQFHDDLIGSATVAFRPDTMGQTKPAPEATNVAQVRHSNAVAGLIGAKGDNGKGVAGMLWRSQLRVYALRPDTVLLSWQSVNRVFVESVLPRLVADGVSIVNLSVALGGPPADSTQQRYLLKGLAGFLRANPRALVVKSTGNDSASLSMEELLSVRSGNALGLLAALARTVRDSAAYRGRILLVTGTQRGGALWDEPSQGANFVRGGVTEIAAPAAQVATLGHPGQGEDAILQSGTSFSAALVSGVAAQLLAMDSTLAPAEVKDYILRGAQASRLSTTTGQMVPAVAVLGAPETIYQLDAYGALTLLSRERQGVPICGYPVRLELDATGFPTGTGIVLDRPGSPIVVEVPSAQSIQSLSVAQGGRLISVLDAAADGSLRSILMDQRGTPGPTIPDVFRMFLEKGYVDRLDYLSAGRAQPWPVFVSSGSPGDTLDPVATVVAPADRPYVQEGRVWLSPAADAALVAYAAGVNDQCVPYINPDIERWLLVPLAGGSATEIGETRYCGPPVDPLYGRTLPYAAAWSHDSRRAVLLAYSWSPSSWNGEITTVLASGSFRVDSVSHAYLWGPVYLADDSLLRVVQNWGSSCDVVLRSASSPDAAISSTPGDFLADCYYGFGTPIIPNAPPVAAGIARGGMVSGGAGPVRSNGFQFAGPARELGRRARLADLRRTLPDRVQVN